MLALPRLQNKYATLQKLEGSPWHMQGLHSAVLGTETIILLLDMETGQHGAIRGHGEAAFVYWYFLLSLFAV